MRTYPTNSPRAAARIVALTMLADGHFCKSDLEALDRLNAHKLLDISPAELQTVVQDLCEDLFSTGHQNWGAACLDPATLAGLLVEIDNPELRITVLNLCTAVVKADAHVAEGEVNMLATVYAQWQLPNTNSGSRRLAAGQQHA